MLRPFAVALTVSLLACGDDGADPGAGGAGGSAPTTTAAETASSTASGPETGAATTGSTSTGEAGAACGPSGATSQWRETCDACVTERCCAEAAACAADPACDGFARCLETCDSDDVACQRACQIPPNAEVQALSLCEGASCFEACGYDEPSCELLNTAGAPDPEACGSCLVETCCDVFSSQTSEWYAFAACTSGCLDAQCLHDCEVAHPEGVAQADASNACLFGACGEPCNGADRCGAFGFGGPPACGDCIRAECCDLHAACSNSIACLDFFTCQQSCGDEASCRLCLELWGPDVASLGWGIHACTQIECDACNGNVCGSVPGLDSSDCRACLEEACCDESAACSRDLDCLALEICVGLCDGDGDCEGGCRSDHPEGEAAFDTLAGCRQASCGGDCP